MDQKSRNEIPSGHDVMRSTDFNESFSKFVKASLKIGRVMVAFDLIVRWRSEDRKVNLRNKKKMEARCDTKALEENKATHPCTDSSRNIVASIKEPRNALSHLLLT